MVTSKDDSSQTERQEKKATPAPVVDERRLRLTQKAQDAQPPRPKPSMATVPAETGAADHNKSKDGDLAQARDAAQSTQPSGDVVYVETD